MIDRRQFIASLSAFALAGPGLAIAAPSRNVSYGSGRVDIYPAGSANSPVLVYVHGGAWAAGSKSSVGSLPSYYNSRGYTVVSVGYSLFPSANIDQQARQVGQAVGWIRNNIAQYGGDPHRIALSGHSAGCHLACLATLSGLAPGVRALIANDTAAYDLAYLAEISGNRLPILYAAPFANRARWHNWSPISYAGGGGRLPVLVAWSGGRNRDRVSRRFADRLEAAGHPVMRFDGRRYSHVSILSAMGRPGTPLTAAMDRFLGQYV